MNKLILVLAVCFGLSACGGSGAEKKQCGKNGTDTAAR